ncbi:DsbA family protein [Anaeromyxobacter oryzisoli]|uniref:DsbA family protein n=1 Tax=Anaeromyxobacter oryzisoli TaxID=2925408 RepID=UPI001F55D969|nr:thioredoxin domain-containing protein [Anaeromyxobacter sp. SG63]
MKHVSWVLALVVGYVLGAVTVGAMKGPPLFAFGRGGAGALPAPAAQARAQRQVEDPNAVYRIAVDDSPARGPADALVTIVEASDFQCPFCKRGAATLKQVEQAYPGKVRIVFKHNPLAFHPNAMPAALAAEAARAQGGDAKFWAMHDKLFELAPALDAASLAKAATEVGLDATKVTEAVTAQRGRDRIERDQKVVTGLGALGTPTFFVNGRKLVGAQPLERFRALVDEELAKAEALVKAGTPASAVYARIVERGATQPVFLPGAPGAPGAAPGAAPSAPPAAPPTIYRNVTIRTDDPTRGPRDAKLTVVLFSDFQCPFCGRVEPSLKQLESAFPGQVRIVWKHQPLPFHSNAMPAALAAEAAREQGKFWPMHDRLFGNQSALSPDDLASAARAIGLDMRRYQAAVDQRTGAARIAEDQKLAAQVGAQGTPTMFFNCRQVVGARPFEQLQAVAREELAKAGRLAGPDVYAKACAANLALPPAAPAPTVVPAAAPAPAPAGPVQGLTLRPDDPAKGGARAPVTLVVFSDFQCPFCSRVEPTLAQVEQVYGNKVRIVWKNQPLPFHPNALPAALAAEAAREQGKFWPMHDKLFANQQALSEQAYVQYAHELGLDLARFDAARRAPRTRARIAEDQALAAKVGAQGTPTLFVNGVKIEGAVPFEMLKAEIDRHLAGK